MMLDVICVSTHYSSRYVSGEEFLRARSAASFECDMVNYVLYLKDDAIFCDFVDEVLVPTAPDILEDVRKSTEKVTWKNMLFLEAIL